MLAENKKSSIRDQVMTTGVEPTIRLGQRPSKRPSALLRSSIVAARGTLYLLAACTAVFTISVARFRVAYRNLSLVFSCCPALSAKKHAANQRLI
jgi:hypothetical protein